MRNLSFIALFFFLYASPLKATPPQKIMAGFATVTSTKTTQTKAEQYSVPMGFAAEYALFLAQDIAVFGQFEMNIESSEQAVIFIGGGGGLQWYLVGGGNAFYNDTYVGTAIRPKYNIFLIVGFAARTFDFTVLETPPEPGVVEIKSAQDASQGSGIGLMFGFGFEYPISYQYVPGFRYQIIQTLGGETQPSLTNNEIILSMGFTM